MHLNKIHNNKCLQKWEMVILIKASQNFEHLETSHSLHLLKHFSEVGSVPRSSLLHFLFRNASLHLLLCSSCDTCYTDLPAVGTFT